MCMKQLKKFGHACIFLNYGRIDTRKLGEKF
jgi:hypothetical protein